MSIGKTKRFEIFKRDGFTCQYCGNRPPDVILEVDHIDPRANGGSDEELNLITACFDCNRGKRDRALAEVRPRPDADLEYLKVQQEIAEARRYLDAKSKRDEIFSELTLSLGDFWCDCLTKDWLPSDKQWRVWMASYSPDEIEEAIRITSPKYLMNQFGHNQESAFFKIIKYVSAILRNRKEDAR